MSYVIGSPTGYVDSTTGKISYPSISIVTKAGEKFGGDFAICKQVTWRRNSDFSTADIEIVDARIKDSNFLSSKGFKVGSEIAVEATVPGGAKEVLFRGYIVKQSMNASGGSDTRKEETVTFSCVDFKYDLFREVIIGQIGFEADITTGKESASGGLYKGGLGWFNALPTVFNDRVFAKHAAPSWAKKKVVGIPLGNARPGVIETDLSTKVFDGDYFALNAGDIGTFVPGTRNAAWSAWDMIQYILAYCYTPPFSFPSVSLMVGAPVFVSKARIVMTKADAGMAAVYPVNVDVQGLNALDAITKVCNEAGYSWWLEPGTGASTLKVWRTGDPGPESLAFFLGTGGSGIPKGVYGTLTAPLAYPSVVAEPWNIKNIQLNIDYTQCVGTIVATTNAIRVQNIFELRTGWTDKPFLKFFKKVAAAEKLDFGKVLETHVYEVKDTPTGASHLYTIRTEDGGQKFTITSKSPDEAIDKVDEDSIASMFRRWITDETGLLNDMSGDARDPFNFFYSGLLKEYGSSYMVRPRPFLSSNLALNKSGDRAPPKTFFAKCSQTQKGVEVAILDIADPINPTEILDRKAGTVDVGGKPFYPFGQKRGSVRVLKNSSGVYIEGGDLNLQCMTYDPKLQKAFVFNPIVLGTVEHDQAKLIVATHLASIGDMFLGRRFIDGNRFTVDRVYANDTKPWQSAQQAKAGIGVIAGTAMSAIPAFSVDELDKMADIIGVETGSYYKAPTVSISATLISVTTAYKLGTKIKGIEGRIDLIADSLPLNSVVAVSFDLQQMLTTVSVESEDLNPILSFNDIGAGLEGDG